MEKGLIQELVDEANKPAIELLEIQSEFDCDECEDKGSYICNGGQDDEYISMCECSIDNELADFSGASDIIGFANDR
jgi:hypothetical protein